MRLAVIAAAAAVLFCLPGRASQPVNADGPQVVWLRTTHDFGAFQEELGVVTCTFQAVNTGTEPLVVVGARSNCGCTRPQYPREAIAPGDTLTLSVGYDAKGRPGRFEKKIYVDTNGGPTATLRVKGTVIGASNSLSRRYPVECGVMRLSASTMPMGEVLKGGTATAVLRAYNHSSDTIRPQVIYAPKYINVIAEPKAVPPGEQFVFSATAASARCPEWGFVTDSVVLAPNPGARSIAVGTVLIVKEDFSRLTPEQEAKAARPELSTKLIDIGRVDKSKGVVTRTFTITNRGEDELIIRRLDTPNPAVTVKASRMRLKHGASATVTVRFDPRKMGSSQLLNARITLITNSPLTPTTLIRVVGQP